MVQLPGDLQATDKPLRSRQRLSIVDGYTACSAGFLDGYSGGFAEGFSEAAAPS
jgi:hypothetical protein